MKVYCFLLPWGSCTSTPVIMEDDDELEFGIDEHTTSSCRDIPDSSHSTPRRYMDGTSLDENAVL
jgi:hypothetical protein